MTATAAPVSVLVPFACPVCGRLREISPRALRAVTAGARTGECTVGKGCRVALDPGERLRRWWLRRLGVDDLLVRRAGGALAYVELYGMPRLPSSPMRTVEVELTQPTRRHTGDEGDLAARARLKGDGAKSLVPSLCYDHAGGDPLLALSLAVEIIARGLPVEALAASAA